MSLRLTLPICAPCHRFDRSQGRLQIWRALGCAVAAGVGLGAFVGLYALFEPEAELVLYLLAALAAVPGLGAGAWVVLCTQPAPNYPMVAYRQRFLGTGGPTRVLFRNEQFAQAFAQLNSLQLG